MQVTKAFIYYELNIISLLLYLNMLYVLSFKQWPFKTVLQMNAWRHFVCVPVYIYNPISITFGCILTYIVYILCTFSMYDAFTFVHPFVHFYMCCPVIVNGWWGSSSLNFYHVSETELSLTLKVITLLVVWPVIHGEPSVFAPTLECRAYMPRPSSFAFTWVLRLLIQILMAEGQVFYYLRLFSILSQVPKPS